jgi:TldD protein
MKLNKTLLLCGIFGLYLHLSLYSRHDSLLIILKDELLTEFGELQEAEYPPYFMEFSANDMSMINISSRSGYITNLTSNRSRTFSSDIRLGSYAFDNTHSFQNDFPEFDRRYFAINELPLDNNQDAIRYSIWKRTNEQYQDALNTYLRKLEQRKSKESRTVADFSKEPPNVYYEPPVTEAMKQIDVESWKKRLNKYSAVFSDTDEIFSSLVNFSYVVNRFYIVNTENTEIVQNKSLCVISLMVMARSNDDEIIPYMHTYYAFHPDGLPNDTLLMQQLLAIKQKIVSLCGAPKAEPYSGPAILSAEAAGVFFHEILGHRIEGHRMDDANNSRTFKGKVGTKVIDKSISINSDPTADRYNENDLIGHYLFDDQGVAAKKVVNINKGLLVDFLMSRKPIEGFERSNGHGRAAFSALPVARQSNLFIETDRPIEKEKLRKMLIKECKKQDKEYGYYFKTVSGGLTNTMTYTPDYFSIFPLEVYKVHTDGRPDELVKGVSLIGTPLTVLSEILGAGDRREVFSGICGAESGPVPVSTVSPALLVRKIETQNQFSFKPLWPVLSNPRKEAAIKKQD